MIFDRLAPRTRDAGLEALLAAMRASRRTRSGASVTPNSAIQQATVYACVRVLAEAVGQLPIHLFQSSSAGSRKAERHPVYRLLHVEPNAFQTPQEFIETLVTHLALRGNFYAGITPRADGWPSELIPVHPDRVSVEQAADFSLTYSVTGLDGAVLKLPASAVLHVKLQSTDGVTGLSPISQARESIGLAIATQDHGATLFANGARPGGVLTTAGKLSREAVKRIRTEFEELHQGPDNLHKLAVLEEGLTYQQIGLTAEDAQFLETRKFQRSEIAGIFRVPPHLVGDLERATFSNIEHQGQDFVVHALMPYLTRIEQRINKQLLRPGEQGEFYAKFNPGQFLRGDMMARADFYSRQIQNGALSPNEVRALEDMNPRPGGDIYLTPANMVINGTPPPPAAPGSGNRGAP